MVLARATLFTGSVKVSRGTMLKRPLDAGERKKESPMSDKWKDRELAGLWRVHWLEDQILAKQDPITEDQLERFGKNPEMIIPDRAVELRRLPAEYSGIQELLLTADGELAFLAKRDGEYVAVVGDRVTLLQRKGFWGNGPDLGVYHLLGVANVDPLWVGTHCFMVGDDIGSDPWDELRANWELKLGDKVLFKTQGVEAFLLLRDYSFIYCVRAKEKNTYKIVKFSNGQEQTIVELETRPIKRFVETADGTIWCFWLDDHGTWICDSLKNNGQQYLRNIVDIVDIRKGTLFIEQLNSRFPRSSSLQRPNRLAMPILHRAKAIGECEYISSFTEFADGRRYAYIGQARHGQQRWVVDGVPQPACNWVSRFFQHPMHGLCYLGLVGHHLLTMQVPPELETK